eukprot:1368143-Pyramimonas_sp.AAC.1
MDGYWLTPIDQNWLTICTVLLYCTVDHCICALRDALCLTSVIQSWGPKASPLIIRCTVPYCTVLYCTVLERLPVGGGRSRRGGGRGEPRRRSGGRRPHGCCERWAPLWT